ncbi:serine/threonine-protein kinase [Nonomuraea sp. NPDC050556]|uniref:serine/threonine-protein kinase n=1 Tax=Nonomuraea sp. NPDC050556 TaxID=3364369 RepID=UPI00379D64BC
MRLVPGDPERLGSYWLAGRLGAGGQGIVYDAYDERGDRYAVKVLHGGVSAQLAKEAQAAQQVASFCTVKIVDVRLDGAPPYIVSEFVEGPSLRQAVEERGAYQGDALRRLATALATALAAVHEAGVVHRDLKPENVLLAPDGPRVIDFGVARTAEMSLTTTGFVAGTPTYMAPEVFTGKRAGPPADVFAWGGVVLYAATGVDPFQAESLGGVMHRVLTVDPDLSAIDAPLRDLLKDALAKDPEQRPAAKDLLMRLLQSPGTDARLAPPEGIGGDRPLGVIAEEVYASLTPQQQKSVPSMLLRMVGEDSVRRIPLDEVEDDDVLCRFSEAGLLVRHSIKVTPTNTADGVLVAVAGDSVAPASGALFHAWPRMRAWLADERTGLAVHRRLREQAIYWDGHRRKSGDLYQGTALDSALTWAATGRRHLELNGRERAFLDASARLDRGRTRRRRVVTFGLAALLAVAVSASVIAVRQSKDLSVKLDEANARAVAARADSLRAADPRAAMRLSVAAFKMSPVFEARTALQRSLAQPEVAAFAAPSGDSEAVYRLTSDGQRLLKWKGDKLTAWDVGSGKKTGEFTLPEGEQSDLSGDGRFVAVAAKGKVRLWDVASGKQVGGPWAGSFPTFYGGLLSTATGRLFAAGQNAPVFTTKTDEGFAVSPDKRWVGKSFSSGAVELWDLVRNAKIYSGEVAAPISAKGETGTPLMAFSDDGALLAVSGDTGMTLVNTATAAERYLQDTAGGQPLFSPDGRFVAELTETAVNLYRVADRHVLATYPTRRAGNQFAFTPDGRTIRYLTDQGSVVSLDVSAPVAAPSPTWPVYDTTPSVLSADGRIAASEAGHEVQLYDAVRRKPIGTVKASGDLALDGKGTILAVKANPVTVWDVATRKRLASLDVGPDPKAIALSQDGTLMAVTRGTTVQLWDLAGRTKVRSVDRAGDWALAFSPDGKLLATGADLVDVASGKVDRDVARLSGRTPTAITFSPDGRTVAYALSRGQVVLWDLAGGREAGTFELSSGDVSVLRFSPDGRMLAVDGEQIRVWESSPLRELGELPVGRFASGLAFSADGKSLRGVRGDGWVQESPVDPALTVTAVCARAGGALTEQEWKRLVPEADYRADTCG